MLYRRMMLFSGWIFHNFGARVFIGRFYADPERKITYSHGRLFKVKYAGTMLYGGGKSPIIDAGDLSSGTMNQCDKHL